MNLKRLRIFSFDILQNQKQLLVRKAIDFDNAAIALWIRCDAIDDFDLDIKLSRKAQEYEERASVCWKWVDAIDVELQRRVQG